MGQNAAQKLIAARLGSGDLTAGNETAPSTDHALIDGPRCQHPLAAIMQSCDGRGIKSARAASLVVGYDASESAHCAVVWAAQEAAQRDCGLTVVSAVDYAGLGLRGPASMARLWLQHARERVALMAHEGAELGQASIPGPPGLEVRPIGKVGSPVRILVEESSTARMLVVGTGARSALAEVALGSFVESVATSAHCPVVVVRPWTAAHPGPCHPVVVGVDGSLAALSAVDAAAGIAVAAGAALTIVGTWMRSPTASRHPSTADNDPGPGGGTEAGVRDAVDTAVARARMAQPCLEVRGTEVEGPAVDVLAAQSARAGLLAVGSRGRGGVPGGVLGSVGNAVARSALCPVAVVGPQAAASVFAAPHGPGDERSLEGCHR
jgi:nucleotide-binding universal stress UspA family protein